MDQVNFSWASVNHIPFVFFIAPFNSGNRGTNGWQGMLLMQRGVVVVVEHGHIIHCKCANNSLWMVSKCRIVLKVRRREDVDGWGRHLQSHIKQERLFHCLRSSIGTWPTWEWKNELMDDLEVGQGGAEINLLSCSDCAAKVISEGRRMDDRDLRACWLTE